MWEALSGLGNSIVGGLGSIGSGLASLFSGGNNASAALGNQQQMSAIGDIIGDSTKNAATSAAGAGGTSLFTDLTKTFQPMNSFLKDNQGVLGLAGGLGKLYTDNRMADIAQSQLDAHNRDVLRNQRIDDQNATSINNAFKPYVVTPTTNATQGLASMGVTVPKLNTTYVTAVGR